MGTKISELTIQTPAVGTEYLECIIPPYTPGTNRRISTQDIADLGGGGGTWGSITGTLSSQTDLQAALDAKSPLLTSATPSTAGATITLDMNSQQQRMFVGSASFASTKTVALSNATVALVLDFHFEVTNVAAVITFPSDFLMADPNWNTSLNEWTPPSVGKYEAGAAFDGTNWKLKINGPFL